MTLAIIAALLCPITAMAEEEYDPLWLEWGYDSLEEFLEWFEITEEEYYAFESELRDYYSYEYDYDKWYQEYLEEQRVYRLERLTEMGGVPGIINVMYNGAFIPFTDVIPEISEGVTYTPAKLFFEALGAEVSYDDKTRSISADFGDYSVQLYIDQKTIAITEGWKTTRFMIDAAPYIRGGYSYIPVRAVAEALGLDVYWDYDYETVVVIDTIGMIADMEKDFTIINSLFRMPFSLTQDEGTYKTTAELLATLKQFNTLDGDSTVKAGANITIYTDGLNTSIKGAIDISEIIDMVIAEYMYNNYYYYYYYNQEAYEEEYEQMKQVFDIIKNAGIEVILNYDEDVMYIRSQIFDIAGLPAVYDETYPIPPKNAWFAFDGISKALGTQDVVEELESYSVGEILGVGSMGELIYSDYSYRRYYNQIFLYSDIMRGAYESKAFLGDDNFNLDGDDYILALTREDMIKKLEIEDEFYGSVPAEFDFKLVINTSGGEVTGLSGSYTFREGPYNSYYNYSPLDELLYGYGYYGDSRTVIEFDLNAEKVYLSVEIHQKNSFILDFVLDMKSEQTDESVLKAPPEGDIVVPAEDYMGEGEEWLTTVTPLSNTISNN